MFTRFFEDVAAICDRDPAARSALEVLTCYPGFHAIILHRVANTFWYARLFWPARLVAQFSRFLTGIEIHPGATIGRRVFIDHGAGVVIGETAIVGDDCTIYHGVTLGGTSLKRGEKRHPTLNPGVVVGAGAKVLGNFTIGSGAKIGANSVVMKPIQAGETVVGNPASTISPNVMSNSKRVDAIFKEKATDESCAYDKTTFNFDKSTLLEILELIKYYGKETERIGKIIERLDNIDKNIEILLGNIKISNLDEKKGEKSSSQAN